MMTETEIIDCLKNDRFIFFYQPKVSMITGKVFGAEALIRLIRPDGTIVPPDEFIPVAEQTSLIRDITRHMFPKLIQDLLVLNDIEPLSVSFNASAKDFEDDIFARTVLKAMETSRLPIDSLQIELTETAALEAGEKIRKNILPLSDAGLSLAMDDYGKGFSSLDTLSKWPFSIIKLDKEIIGRMFDSEKHLTIIETSIRMAHELGISVVAEGVETSEQYRILLGAGCTKTQGFWISKALPLDKYIAFIKEGTRWSGMPVGLIHMAAIDHVQWRKKLVGELIKMVNFPKDSPRRKYPDIPPLSCKECRLGRWYHGAGQMFRDRQSFRSLEKPHTELHNIGRSLVELVSGGASMQEAFPLIRELSERSMEIMGLLHTLEIEGMMDMLTAHEDWSANILNPAYLD